MMSSEKLVNEIGKLIIYSAYVEAEILDFIHKEIDDQEKKLKLLKAPASSQIDEIKKLIKSILRDSSISYDGKNDQCNNCIDLLDRTKDLLKEMI